MKPLRIYLDTSVFGGCADPEFEKDSNRIMQGIRDGYAMALISEVVLKELAKAPSKITSIFDDLPSDAFERIQLTKEMDELRKAYLQSGILGPKWADDLLHVAVATVARADAIISWNFRHIVRLDKIKAYNRVNFEMGYGVLTILSPKEVVFHEEE
jgi:predicted nucleic acid-binding protein